MPGTEKMIRIESIRIPEVRADAPGLVSLAASIEKEGLRHPITVWADGTLVSGRRRLLAYVELVNSGRPEYGVVPSVVVDNVEAAAKRLLADNGDEADSVSLKPSEVCRLWEVLRRLDEPAAARRLDEARRRGVELRKQTQNGNRKPGRSRSRGHGDEYLMTVLGEPFGMAEATASRLWAIHKLATSTGVADDRRAAAAQSLADLDAGQSSIWANYSRLVSGRVAPVSRVRIAAAAESAPAARQRAAWERTLPQLEGLTAGLTELGPPNPDLTWDQVGPVHARLMKIRRDLEKVIKSMKETAQS